MRNLPHFAWNVEHRKNMEHDLLECQRCSACCLESVQIMYSPEALDSVGAV